MWNSLFVAYSRSGIFKSCIFSALDPPFASVISKRHGLCKSLLKNRYGTKETEKLTEFVARGPEANGHMLSRDGVYIGNSQGNGTEDIPADL